MRHIIPISGKDSLATAIVQMARKPDLPYEFLFLDVGMELPETLAWVDKVEIHLNQPILRAGRSLYELMGLRGKLPSHQVRFCTGEGKKESAEKLIGKDHAIQYIGIRSDEGRPEIPSVNSHVTNHYPLVECGIDLQGVYRILDDRDLMPPQFFWQRLWDDVYNNVEKMSRDYMDGMKRWVKSHLFSWRSRSNCFMCFYQRLYEWVGLLEHHPHLFDEAERIEKRYGSVEEDGRDKAFHLRTDGPLDFIRQRKDEIYRDRVRKVTTAVVQGKRNVSDSEFDLLSLTSCGNYCGK